MTSLSWAQNLNGQHKKNWKSDRPNFQNFTMFGCREAFLPSSSLSLPPSSGVPLVCNSFSVLYFSTLQSYFLDRAFTREEERPVALSVIRNKTKSNQWINYQRGSLILHQLCCPITDTRGGKQRTKLGRLFIVYFLVKEIGQFVLPQWMCL